jgi:formylglycine-generating enzyme required for sulfatase activity
LGVDQEASTMASGTTGDCAGDMVALSSSGGMVCIDRTEVTVAEFDELRSSVAADCEGAGQVEDGVDPTLPVTFVKACEAQTYCAKRGKRLCSRKEWTSACNGLTVDPYENCNVGNSTFKAETASLTCVNTEGAGDLVGNVWEWVCDGASCVVVGGDASSPVGLEVGALWALHDEAFAATTVEANYVGFRCCRSTGLPGI